MKGLRSPVAQVRHARLLTFFIGACFIFGAGATIFSARALGPHFQALGSFTRTHGFGGLASGAIGGIAIGGVLALIFGTASFLPLFIGFSCFGPRCRACRKPLLGPGVGRTGRCWFCGAPSTSASTESSQH